MNRPSEDDLIARYFAPLAGAGGLGLRDDAALISPPPGRDIVATVDGLVAGVHFFADDPPDTIARKALRVNLSDLAAKGARPEGFLLTLALPKDWRAEWLDLFARALGEDAKLFACPLLGGDTVSTPGPLTLSITALGSVARGRMVPRTGVRAGDALYVSGTIGDAALGLALRADVSLGAPASSRRPTSKQFAAGRLEAGAPVAPEDAAFLIDRYLLPQPRLALAAALAAHASGAMDVSDGLVGDLTKMLRVSGVTANVDAAKIPLSPAAARMVASDPTQFSRAITGGDDYEILASVPPAETAAFEIAAREMGVPVARIGVAVAGQGAPTFRDISGEPMRFAHGSFSHF